MCGRYTLHISKKKLLEAIRLELPETYLPNYNISPGQEALGILKRPDAATTAEMLNWGLKTPQNFHVNARLETADNTPRFRESWMEHRCLIPANGFYEWYQDGISKVPYYFYPPQEGLIYFAGLWFPSDQADNSRDYVILTTEATPAIREIHARMPVILPSEVHSEWLDLSLNKQTTLEIAAQASLLKHTVSRRVNSTQNKDSRLIEATSPLNDDQMMLF
jgi:putative SOS response-associated peptidase YedK